MNPRDLFLDLDEDDAPSVYPTFRHGMKVELIDHHSGEQAGIKSAKPKEVAA